MSVKAVKRRASGRSEAESLDGHRSGGYGVHDGELLREFLLRIWLISIVCLAKAGIGSGYS